jgi:hypothetical protein
MDIQKQKKLIEKFLSNWEVDHICGFWVDYSYSDKYSPFDVFLIIDTDWFDSLPLGSSFVIAKLKEKLRDDIQQWLGINVFVRSIGKKCKKDKISESIKKSEWTEKADKCLFEVLNSVSKETFDSEKDFINKVFNSTIHHFIQSNLNISDSKEIGELYRILKNPFKKHIIKNHKGLLKNRYKLLNPD